jgi:hypothetical protein
VTRRISIGYRAVMEIRVVEANDEQCSPTPHALSTTPTPPRSVPNLCAHPCSPTVTVRSRRVTHSAHLHIHTVDDADSSMTRLAWSTEMGRRSIITSAAPPPPAARTSPPPHPHCIPIYDRYMGRETARTRTPQGLSLRAQREKTSQLGSIIVPAATSRPQCLLLSQRAPPRPDSRGRRLLNQAKRRRQRRTSESRPLVALAATSRGRRLHQRRRWWGRKRDGRCRRGAGDLQAWDPVMPRVKAEAHLQASPIMTMASLSLKIFHTSCAQQ